MKVSIFLSDGGELSMDHMDDASALDFKDEIVNGTKAFLTLDMDDATIVIAREHLVRIDFD